MNFCAHCNFMLYKKINTPDGEEKSGPSELYEFCKNCGYEKLIEDDSISVYKRNYKSSFAIDNIINNKYIIYDNTLPRLSISCKNENCITKDKYVLNENNTIFIGNVPENISTNRIKEFMEAFEADESIKESVENDDYIKTVDGIQINFKRLRLDSIVIYYTNISDNPDDSDKILSLNENLKQYVTSTSIDSEMDHSGTLEIEDYRTINDEVLYVKYDPDNMKYLYMCVNCGTNW